MGLRTRAIVFGIVIYLVSPLGLALGLGEISIKSYLNQPLDAEIQLLKTRELTAQEILVGLGSREDFTRVDVDRPFFLSDLKFTVEMKASNGPIIRVKSNSLVREPFLNFIVQTQWPSGKLLREYTVLLDLPVFSEEPARAVTAAKAQARPAPARKRAQPRRQASRFNGDTYGPVSSIDTLWAIATQTRPDDEVSIQQMMLAIQRLNPNAFINNNINLLKKGAVLRLPLVSDITDFDPHQAKREVANQNALVKKGVLEAQIDASRSKVDRGGEVEQVQGRVKLSSATDVTGSKSGFGGGEGEQETNTLRTQLLNTQEKLTATQRENTDLNARVQAMDEQTDTMARLLEVTNGELRKLELALAEHKRAEANVSAEESLLEALDAARAEAEANNADGLTDSDGEAVEATVKTTEAEVAVEPTSEVLQSDSKPIRPSPSPYGKPKPFMDILMENLLYIVGGGGVVLLIGGLVYRGRPAFVEGSGATSSHA